MALLPAKSPAVAWWSPRGAPCSSEDQCRSTPTPPSRLVRTPHYRLELERDVFPANAAEDVYLPKVPLVQCTSEAFGPWLLGCSSCIGMAAMVDATMCVIAAMSSAVRTTASRECGWIHSGDQRSASMWNLFALANLSRQCRLSQHT